MNGGYGMTNHRRGHLARIARGFTLVEILIVVMLVVIVAAVAAPMAVDARDYTAKAMSETLVADMEYAQIEAIVTQTPVTVTFDLDAQTYSLSNASGDLVHPIDKSAYAVGLDPSSVEITSVDFGGDDAVTFDVLGAPSAAGTVTIQAGTTTYTVSVMAATGLVSIEE